MNVLLPFRKKPVVVQAVLWRKNGDHPLDNTGRMPGIAECEGEVVRYFRHPGKPGHLPCSECSEPFDAHGWIDTKQGGHTVCPGDWIIEQPGTDPVEHYPCKPAIFAVTYEPVDALAPVSTVEPQNYSAVADFVRKMQKSAEEGEIYGFAADCQRLLVMLSAPSAIRAPEFIDLGNGTEICLFQNGQISLRQIQGDDRAHVRYLSDWEARLVKRTVEVLVRSDGKGVG